MTDFILCSECFGDTGLKLDAFKLGIEIEVVCPNCGSEKGKKLHKDLVARLAHRFFVRGTVHRCRYGGAPVIQFNEHQKSSINAPQWLQNDVRTLEKALSVGFFHYGPRLWMVGEIEPLNALQDPSERGRVIQRIITEYPTRRLNPGELFYRLRRNPESPTHFDEYDSPPDRCLGSNRLDSNALPVMYGSQDLEVCAHECRVTVEDELFFATITPHRDLKLLDLTEILRENTTEFESLDIAVHMLFLAGSHSYEISREIALAAQRSKYDGMIYPSYFSLARTGAMPFETIYGLSIRIFPGLEDHARAQVIPNLAIFGRPIASGVVTVTCINRLVLNKVIYDIHFGPADY